MKKNWHNPSLQTIAARWAAPAELIGGGCFAIALPGCAPAPPIKAIELTAPQPE